MRLAGAASARGSPSGDACGHDACATESPSHSEPAGERPSGPFGRGDEYRAPRIAIDRSSAPPGPALDLLLDLGAGGHAELWSTVNESLDATVTIDLASTGSESIPVTTQYSDGRRSLGGIWPRDQWTRFVDEHTARTGAARSAVEGRFLVAAALMERVDGLVVGDLDFGPAATLAARSNPMPPEAACALVGLAARLRGDFSIASVPCSFFHFLVTRGLLDQGWRWFAACVASSHAPATTP